MSTDVEKYVAAYRKIRDAIKEKELKYKEEVAELKEQQDMVASKLLEFCNESNLDSYKTSEGTVSRRVSTRYWTSDWNSMKNFIKEHDAFELMEQRVHQTNMKSFLEDNPNLMPPGMNIDSRYAITVRRK